MILLCILAISRQHLRHLDNVLQGLDRAGIQLRVGKCKFAYREVEFLGHLVSERGRRLLPATLSRIESWPQPNNKKYIRRFMGLINWYREYVPGIAVLAQPLHERHSLGVDNGMRNKFLPVEGSVDTGISEPRGTSIGAKSLRILVTRKSFL